MLQGDLAGTGNRSQNWQSLDSKFHQIQLIQWPVARSGGGHSQNIKYISLSIPHVFLKKNSKNSVIICPVYRNVKGSTPPPNTSLDSLSFQFQPIRQLFLYNPKTYDQWKMATMATIHERMADFRPEHKSRVLCFALRKEREREKKRFLHWNLCLTAKRGFLSDQTACAKGWNSRNLADGLRRQLAPHHRSMP